MTFENWMAFTLASLVLTLIPGPSVLLVISQALARGKNAAMMCILGDMVGTIVLVALSFLGVGALLAASAVLFQIVKWAGILYLVYLGLRQILDARSQPEEFAKHDQSTQTSWGSFCVGSVTAILNPKAIMFYMAFLAQFISTNGNFFLQLGILTITSMAVVAIVLTGYAMIAARARLNFQSQKTRKNIGYAGGGLMIGGSVLMASQR